MHNLVNHLLAANDDVLFCSRRFVYFFVVLFLDELHHYYFYSVCGHTSRRVSERASDREKERERERGETRTIQILHDFVRIHIISAFFFRLSSTSSFFLFNICIVHPTRHTFEFEKYSFRRELVNQQIFSTYLDTIFLLRFVILLLG